MQAENDDELRERIACSLTDEALRERRAMVRESLFPHILETQKLTSSLIIVFPDTDTLRSDVEAFASLERQCCRFLTFSVKATDDGLTLTIEGPPEARAALEMLADVIEGSE